MTFTNCFSNGNETEDSENFYQDMRKAYEVAERIIYFGAPLFNSKVYPKVEVGLALSTVNKHGVISGATGTGKTKTLQSFAEQLSEEGISVFLSDVKGDLSGMAQSGILSSQIQDRCKKLGIDFEPKACPVEFLTIDKSPGTQCRTTVESFGPILFGKMLEATDSQQGVLTIAFRFAKDNNHPLNEIADLRKVLNLISTEDKEKVRKDYGQVASASINVLQRKLLQLQDQGVFCGKPVFDVNDLLRTQDGKGIISILSLKEMQDQPLVFSTFMLWMLNELYQKLPEVGDLKQPKLVFFFDEAHYVFENASQALLDQIERVCRLIRSKGVGIYFISQYQKDIPIGILGQLGNRIQHALRSFTPEDEKAIAATSKTFTKNQYIDIKTTLTNMGIGEALITVLSPEGIPTPTVHCLMAPPKSKMGPGTSTEIQLDIEKSKIHSKYTIHLPLVGEKTTSVIDDILNSSMLKSFSQEAKKEAKREIKKEVKRIIVKKAKSFLRDLFK